MGFTSRNEAYEVAQLGAKGNFGDYYIIKQKKAEFFYLAKTEVEAVGITREHFLAVLDKYPKRGHLMKEKAIERHVILREAIVLFGEGTRSRRMRRGIGCSGNRTRCTTWPWWAPRNWGR